MCRAIQRPDLSQIGRDIQTQNPQVKSTCGRIMVESLETEYPEGIQNTEAGAVLLSARSHEVHHQFLFKQRMILIYLNIIITECAMMCNVSHHVTSSSSTDVWPSSASKIMPSHFSPVHPGVDQQEHKSVGSKHLLSAAFSRRNLSCQIC